MELNSGNLPHFLDNLLILSNREESRVSFLKPSVEIIVNTFEPLLNPVAAASLLDIHPVTLLRWARESRVPHHRVGRKVKFRASDLNAWLASGYTDTAVHAASTRKGEAI